jgi:ubiquinone/menaquinone biosynthesis C-methylase UbiE
MPAPDARPETYTHGHHESVLRSHRWRTVENSAAYVVAQLRPGIRVLDVGCGPGTITVDLAVRVAPGEVIGVDAAADVLDAARAAAGAAGTANVSFVTGDVYALEYDDASFDLVHAHQVLQHLADPVGALREMRRVCAPGGTVAARDSDYGAMTWYPAVPALDRWLELYQAVARRNRGDPDAGRRLLSWARAAGFAAVEPSASVWCFATATDRAWWGGLWADRVEASAFAEQAVGSGLTDAVELAGIAAGWREWAAADDGWFAVLHGEVRCLP